MQQKSKVYFCDMRTVAGGMNLAQKLGNLITKAGIASLNLKDKYVAIKMHLPLSSCISASRATWRICVRNLPRRLPT